MSTVSRNQEVSRGKRCISRGGFRTASTHGHKRQDVKEPGLRPAQGVRAEFRAREQPQEYRIQGRCVFEGGVGPELIQVRVSFQPCKG